MGNIGEILILGALPLHKTEEVMYEGMARVCLDYAERVFSPIDTLRFEGSDEQRYERAMRKVEDADWIIGEQTNPSTGQGLELGYALTLEKPILVVAERGSKVSGLIKGCPLIKDILHYDSQKDLEVKMYRFLREELVEE